MLQLKNIYKSYIVGEEKQQVLKDINIAFRKNEFVSILGASGSGKTTLLNIIGGLDVYDSGDLIIDNLSTKNFTKKNWDSYRNYKIGFVFQNYNLISHLSVLGNVELALTLSGINKKDRREKAKDALTKVGLKDHINKKPNQLSGGQMQRVAIARAIVNNPDIILADEPTGALDSNTSVQIMDILKEISKNKLIIMVTHNKEIANNYSDRIIELKDGEIVGDSNSYKVDNRDDGIKIKFNKTNMPYLTTLSLSLKNLLTKKGRTFLTSFAGSIGILGICLVLILNSGLKNYINKFEKETLEDFPITISQSTLNMDNFFSNSNLERNKCEGDICSYDDVVSSFTKKDGLYVKNDLKFFKKYIENNNSIKEYVKNIDYEYDYTLPIYYKYKDDFVKITEPLIEFVNEDDGSATSFSGIKFNKINFEYLKENDKYTLVAGNYPETENDMVLLIPNDGIINDSVLYYLYLKDKNNVSSLINKNEKIESTTYSYDTFLKLKYKLVYNTDVFQKVDKKYVSKINDKDYMKNLITNGINLNIVGILKYTSEDENSEYTSSCIYYSEELFKNFVQYINDSEIVKEQINNKDIDVFTGEKFDSVYTSYDRNMLLLNSLDIDNPESISLVPKDFDSKNKIKEYIDNYNKEQVDKGDKTKKIFYTDENKIVLAEISSIVSGVSAVLIGVVSISLIVSSIMIAIITYISVLERTKEIGVLKALGASGKDISRVFKSETIIEGVIAGVLGVSISVLLSIPINIILKTLVKVDINFSLPLMQGVIMILLSVLLNVIAGLIPSKMASKKNPVDALRSE